MSAEFQTHEEADAFQAYIDSTDEDEVRNDRDEALVRNGWLAARDYFDRPVKGEDKTEVSDAMISASDLGLRREALAFAVQSVGGHETLDRAKAYLSFLQGK